MLHWIKQFRWCASFSRSACFRLRHGMRMQGSEFGRRLGRRMAAMTLRPLFCDGNTRAMQVVKRDAISTL
jgi:hypothetical protein